MVTVPISLNLTSSATTIGSSRLISSPTWRTTGKSAGSSAQPSSVLSRPWRYERRGTHQRNPRQVYLGGGGGLMPSTPNCVLKQTGPGTWDHLALLAPSLPLHNDSANASVDSASPDPQRSSLSTNYCRSPRMSLSKLSMSRSHRHNNCCQCAAGDLAQTVTVATINNRRRSSTIHLCLRGNLHQFNDV
ncbi:uncharacterized protein LOC121857863 [Homarus americanus]|uniref:uncharacterized protein LOC121857863 n=1 Tax=Homarus americanus TaxID=6706 RepID=UPI001C49472B|nr:uncharacterized protein LOC121857863 [Homarus americanus]